MTVESAKAAAQNRNQAAAPENALVIQAFPAMLERYKSEVSQMLPAHLRANVDRYARLALSEFRQNQKLRECDPRSVFASVILASRMGWEIGGVLGHAYLVPYGGEAQLVPGWKGYVDLVHRSGKAQVWTGAVFQGDEFEYVLGARPDVRHVSCGEDDPEKMTHTYSVGWVVGQSYPIVEVWTREKLIRHRDRYNKVGRRHYSFENLEMYGRKIPLLQVVKYLPLNAEISSALSLDTVNERGGKQNISINAAAEGAFFPSAEVPATPPAELAESTTQEAAPTAAEEKKDETKATETTAVVMQTKAEPAKVKEPKTEAEKKVPAKETKESKPAAKAKEEPKAKPSPEVEKPSEAATSPVTDESAPPPEWAREDEHSTIEPPTGAEPEAVALDEKWEEVESLYEPQVQRGKSIGRGTKVSFPAIVTVGDGMPRYTPEQYEQAKALLAQINSEASIEKTVAEWFNGTDISVINAETMDCMIAAFASWS